MVGFARAAVRSALSAVWIVVASCTTGPRVDQSAPGEDERLSPAMTTQDDGQENAGPGGLAVEVAEGPESPSVELYPGTGIFVDRTIAARRMISVDEQGDITLNFADADLREVVRSILGGILRSNFIIDPAVKGSVTVQTSRPLAKSAILPMLEEILRVNGAGLIRADGIYEIISLGAGARIVAEPRFGRQTGADAFGFGLQIVPLKFVSATEMKKILQPLVPRGLPLSADAARNILTFSGTRTERANLLDLVETFDIDWLEGMSFGLVPVRYADPDRLVDDLEEIFGDPGNGPLSGVLRLVPLKHVSSVLVVSTQAKYLKDAQVWIERLDRGGDGNDQRLFVYYVQNGRAVELARILDEILPTKSTARAVEPELAPGLEPVTIRSEAVGPAPAQGTEPVPVEPASQPYAGDEPAVVRSESPGLLAQSGGPTRSPGAGLAIRQLEDIRIVADEVNNALLVMATPRQYRIIESALSKLDIVPLQVLIEATIAEVTLNDELSYGVQWFFREGNHGVTLSEVAGGAAAQIFPGFSYLFDDSQDVRAVLNALDSITDVNIISSPQLMVLDNHTATLQVGDEVPIAIQSSVSTLDPDSPIVNTIEFRDTGVILSVTPRVNSGGMVIMEIEQEVSDVTETTTSGIDSPTIQQRRISSTVAVMSGQTIALGGLIRDRQGKENTGVPLLKDIPLLGALFGARKSEGSRTELLVLITPRVVSNGEEARLVTEELRRRLPALVPLEAKITAP